MTFPTETDIERAQLAAQKATGALVSKEAVRAILLTLKDRIIDNEGDEQ